MYLHSWRGLFPEVSVDVLGRHTECALYTAAQAVHTLYSFLSVFKYQNFLAGSV